MKHQIQFSWKNEKNVSNVAEILDWCDVVVSVCFILNISALQLCVR